MKKFYIISAIATVVLALAISCGRLDFGGMIWAESDVVDKRFEQSLEYNATIPDITMTAPENNYRVYVFGDSHVDGPTRHLDRFVTDFQNDANSAPFALCVGDMINSTGHYGLFCDHVAVLGPDCPKRLFVTAGNHDLYFGQWTEYKNRFHTSTYSFEVQTPSEGTDLYISLDSASGTLGVKQRAWLGDLLDSAKGHYRNIIVFTHTHFFMRDYTQTPASNFSMEETHDLMDLFSRSGVKLVISGHDHFREDVLYKGVLYYTLDALGDPYKQASYAVFTIGSGDVKVQIVKEFDQK